MCLRPRGRNENFYGDPNRFEVIYFGEVRRAQLAISTLVIFTMGPLGSFKVCSDAKKERVGCRKQREVTAPVYP